MLLTMLSVLALDCSPQQSRAPRTPEVSRMRKARDPNIAVQEELCMARSAGTAAAYDLFIARHPEHPLADVARQERRALLGDKPRP